MRETRPSGLEGGVRFIPHPYPYPWFANARQCRFSPNSVGRARHSVRAAPATSGRKISPASPSRPAADPDFDRVSRTNFDGLATWLFDLIARFGVRV